MAVAGLLALAFADRDEHRAARGARDPSQHRVGPRTREYATHHDAWQNAILHDGCVGLTTRSAIHSAHRDLRLIPLLPPATFALDLLWRPDTPLKPALRALIDLAAEVTRAQADGPTAPEGRGRRCWGDTARPGQAARAAGPGSGA